MDIDIAASEVEKIWYRRVI